MHLRFAHVILPLCELYGRNRSSARSLELLPGAAATPGFERSGRDGMLRRHVEVAIGNIYYWLTPNIRAASAVLATKCRWKKSCTSSASCTGYGVVASPNLDVVGSCYLPRKRCTAPRMVLMFMMRLLCLQIQIFKSVSNFYHTKRTRCARTTQRSV